jgi:hypothetical protein
MVNPPYEVLGEICAKQAAMFFHVAAMAPSVAISRATVSDGPQAGSGAKRIEVVVENRGYLGTDVIESARRLPWNEPLRAEIATEGGLALVLESDRRVEVGHLAGWGRGLFDGSGALFYQRSRGSASSKTLSWAVTGSGVLTVRVGSCRVGWIEKRIEVG